jgi:hypothetical protein
MIAFFKRGLIPGPGETNEQFLLRVAKRKPLQEWKLISSLPPEWSFSVDWVPIKFSSKKLFPWEGAVFWDGPLIQVHPALQKGKLFGNSLEDLLHHESIHAAREAFHEPMFEEVLAYSVSRSPWKRFFGPLFQRTWEFPLFALAIFFLPLFPLFAGPIVALFLLRLMYKQLVFYRIKKKYPLSVIICLTDREIRSHNVLFSDGSPRSRLIHQLLQLH